MASAAAAGGVGRPSARSLGDVRRALLLWYAAHGRDLPWRRTKDPYAILVSEVMLQQTQVATVVPYYERFLAQFPNVETLAAATQDEVLKAWEGLGYYARARNLRRAAQVIVEEQGGVVPGSLKELLKLPGVGRNTAAAVASIAFGRDEPVLDGNVTRVLCRLFGVEDDPTKAETKRALLELAGALIPRGQAGRSNQALMDLGATVCTGHDPKCPSCTLGRRCVAKRQGRVDELPQRRRKRAVPHVEVAAGLVWDRPRSSSGARLLITKRRPDDMLGGLWEFPGGKKEVGETLEECLARELKEELGIKVELEERFLTVRHAYSHFRVTLATFHCRHAAGEPEAIGCAEHRWVQPADLDRYAFPSADLRIIAALRDTAAAQAARSGVS